MNKKELVSDVSRQCGKSQRETRVFLDAFMEVLQEKIGMEETVELMGFGTFHPWNQSARMARNPRTKEPYPLAPRLSVKFKPGKNFLKRINK